ncbi:MAG: hypothetical protein AB2604_01620 [Candidatus Thiodiazotropha taylori]
MFTDHEKAKNVAATIQSIVLSLAVIIGGGWSAWEFYKLRTVEKAKLQLDVLEKTREQKAILNISLDAKKKDLKDGKKYIEVNVRIENKGLRDAYLDYSKPVLRVTKVSFDDDGKIKFTNKRQSYIYMPGGHIPNALSRSSETLEYPIMVQLEESGTYLLRFVVDVAEENKRNPKGVSDFLGQWTKEIFITVD